MAASVASFSPMGHFQAAPAATGKYTPPALRSQYQAGPSTSTTSTNTSVPSPARQAGSWRPTPITPIAPTTTTTTTPSPARQAGSWRATTTTTATATATATTTTTTTTTTTVPSPASQAASWRLNAPPKAPAANNTTTAGSWRSRSTSPTSTASSTTTTDAWRSRSSSPTSTVLTAAEAGAGTIAYLPNITGDSVLHPQLARANQTGGFFGHPVLIVGPGSQAGTVKFLAMTSFGSQTVSEKWQRATNKGEHVKHYVPIAHESTQRLGAIPILSTERGMTLAKQTYVSIREEYEVELAHLEKFKCSGKEGHRLTTASTQDLANYRQRVDSGIPIIV